MLEEATGAACGVRGVRIEDPRDFLGRLKAALESGEPTRLDVIVDENAHPPVTSFGDRFGSPF